MQIKPPTKKQINVFVFGLSIILLLFSRRAYKFNHTYISLLLITAVFILLITYLTNKNLVIKFYKIWMKAAFVIGIIVNGLLMILIFYLIFTPVGIFLRIIKKDILKLKKEQNLKSYWLDKPQKEFNKSDYEKQF